MTESVIIKVQRLVRELYRPFDGTPELVRGFGEAALAVTESRSARIVLRNPEGAEDLQISVGEEEPFRGPLLRSRFPVRYQGSELGFLEVSTSTRRRGSAWFFLGSAASGLRRGCCSRYRKIRRSDRKICRESASRCRFLRRGFL